MGVFIPPLSLKSSITRTYPVLKIISEKTNEGWIYSRISVGGLIGVTVNSSGQEGAAARPGSRKEGREGELPSIKAHVLNRTTPRRVSAGWKSFPPDPSLNSTATGH